MSHAVSIVVFAALGTLAVAAIYADVIENLPAIKRALRRKR